MAEHPSGASKNLDLNGIPFTHNDIYRVVDDFYTRVQHDPLLQVPFGSVTHWPEHIEKLTHFWWIRFGGEPYLDVTYNPVMKHYLADFNSEFLARWLELFHATLKDNLREEQARLWALISERMGESLSERNEMVKRAHSEQR